MANKNIIIFVGILAVLVFVGAMVFVFWRPAPQPSVTPSTPVPLPEKEALDTSDWKIYRNEEYGFEVMYPPNYIFQHPIETGLVYTPKFLGRFITQEDLTEQEECKKLVTECCHLGFFVEINDRETFFSRRNCDKTKTLQECISKICRTQPGATAIEGLCGKLKIGNYEWTRAGWMGMCGSENFYIENNNLVYEFYTEDWEKAKLRVFHQILSTFKFIK
jgi:hypothetical protein